MNSTDSSISALRLETIPRRLAGDRCTYGAPKSLIGVGNHFAELYDSAGWGEWRYGRWVVCDDHPCECEHRD